MMLLALLEYFRRKVSVIETAGCLTGNGAVTSYGVVLTDSLYPHPQGGGGGGNKLGNGLLV